MQAKIFLKASSDVQPALFVQAASQLRKQVQTLMWGEAGSPVMIYKTKKTSE